MQTVNYIEIIEGCVKKQIKSQEQLYRLMYPDMIKVCFRYAPDADGAASIYNNAMLKVFNNIEKYKEDGKLKSWVKVIVTNCCIDFCKQKNIFKNSIESSDYNDVILEPEVFNNISAKEVRAVINSLPKATAIVFQLFVYEGLTHKQIAEQLSISESTSKWHLSEAKTKLKNKFVNPYKINIHAAG